MLLFDDDPPPPLHELNNIEQNKEEIQNTFLYISNQLPINTSLEGDSDETI